MLTQYLCADGTAVVARPLAQWLRAKGAMGTQEARGVKTAEPITAHLWTVLPAVTATATHSNPLG